MNSPYRVRPSIVAAAILAVLLLASTSVWATGSHTPPPDPTPPHSTSNSSATGVGVGVGIAASKSNSSANSAAVAKGGNASATGGKAASYAQGGKGGQGGAGGKGGASNASQGQQQSASSDQAQGQQQQANNAGVQQGVEFSQNYEAARIPVSTAIAGFGQSTSECLKGGGAGAQSAGFGISFGGSKRDRDCARFVLAQSLYARGQRSAADRIFCQITEVKLALGGDCIALINEQTVYISREEEIELRKSRVGFPANK